MSNGLFRVSAYLQPSVIATTSGRELDMATLPAYLRTLLVADGTVTKSLEAWFWEPVTVELLAQEELVGCVNQAYLDDNSEALLLQRQVLLKGKQSERVFAFADSTIVLSALPDKLSQGLRQGSIGIGEILRRSGVETFRDIMSVDLCDSIPFAQLECVGPYLKRSYVIELQGIRAIRVSEYFPMALYI